MTGGVMALETFPYDAADYLTTPEAIFYFLEAELEEDEPSYWPSAIATVARSRGGVARLAEETALPLEDLQRAIDETVTPDRNALVRVMEAYRRRMTSGEETGKDTTLSRGS
jgi:probable addiction module antidote protein